MPPRRPRELVPRERDVVLRERDAVLRDFEAVLRGLDAVLLARVAVERFAVERFAGALRAADDRVALLLTDLARVERFAVDRFPVDFRVLVERFAVDLRAGFDAVLAPEEVEAEPSIDHFPDMTRCAASATASAMIEPSLVALDAIALAACDAVSAASSPASRIFLRAAGLALIAAAAAARPAASISLLIAAFASLSILLAVERREDAALERGDDEREPEDVEREELLRVDFAIFYLPPGKDTLRLFRFPNEVAMCESSRGARKQMSRPRIC